MRSVAGHDVYVVADGLADSAHAHRVGVAGLGGPTLRFHGDGVLAAVAALQGGEGYGAVGPTIRDGHLSPGQVDAVALDGPARGVDGAPGHVEELERHGAGGGNAVQVLLPLPDPPMTHMHE